MWQRLYRNIRYDLPLHFILRLTDWLPDNAPLLRLRGALARPFFMAAGGNLRLGRNLTFYNPGMVSLGRDVYIALGTWLSASAPIVVESEVLFGPYCVVASGNHTRRDGSFRFGVSQSKPIRVGKGCWIASHAVLTAGCTIGNGSVIAAGSVVAGDISPNVIAAGMPARQIKILPQ